MNLAPGTLGGVRLRRLVGGLLAVAVSGCAPPPAPVGVGDCGDIGFPAGDSSGSNGGLLQHVFLEGQVELRLEPPTYGLCPPDFDYPRLSAVSAARLDIPDAAEEEVEVEVSSGRRGRTVVRLPRASPGTYRVVRTVTPDPRTGKPSMTFASTFHVAEDRRSVGVQVLPYACTRLDRSIHGTWVCDHHVLRDGALLEQLPEGWHYAVSGSVIWGVSPEDGQVARWVDLGSGPLERQSVSRPEAAGDVPSGRPALVASGQELLVRRRTTVEHYAMSPEGETAGWVSTTVVPPGRLLARVGTQVLLDDESEGGGPSPDVCPYWLVPSGLRRTLAPCVRAGTSLGGMDEEGLWSMKEGLVLFAPVDGGIKVLQALPFLSGLGDISVLHGAILASPAFQLVAGLDEVLGPHLCAAPSREPGQPRRLAIYAAEGPLKGARRELLWGEVSGADAPSTWVVER